MNCINVLTLAVLLSAPADDELFRANVRTTDPLTPEQQQRTFHLPAGFEIQLVASEPDIQKPMNLAFDAAGRLWMSGSVEYPYAAQEDRGHDAIKVLEDSDGDGRADKITTFADGLNIPIGLYPYRDGVIAYSMPNIWFLRDTDGDGRADRREVLYGPLGNPRDTHGMQNAFRRGFDGWLYVNHGFANETTITGRDGSSIKLQSGNTYRVRLDGSRVEQFTWGQVNPFGSVCLADGDFITADCHSKPLTLLLRGACYSSFGKPDDGLGFAPDLMSHDHGSTAICGVAQLSGEDYPAEFRGRLLVGNVMTSRINQDSLRYSGATPQAIEQADFLSTDDPWFRPVDIQVGPDGAIYVADFYNRIIGHYEVPLEHPGRDKARARIWRIVYRGNAAKKSSSSSRSLAQADTAELLAALGSDRLTVRMLATDQLTDRIGESAVPTLQEAMQKSDRATTRLHAMWALHRLKQLPTSMLATATRDSEPLVRLHAQRVLSETANWTAELTEAVKRGMTDDSALVQRAAADAAGQQSDSLVRESLDALQKVPADDPVLRHTLKIAIRNQMRKPAAWNVARNASLSPDTRSILGDVALGVPTAEAAEFLFGELKSAARNSLQVEAQLNHLALHLPDARLPELFAMIRSKLDSDLDLQARLLIMLDQRLTQRGKRESTALREWARDLAGRLFAAANKVETMWTNRTGENPWGLEPRKCADGQSAIFLSSLPGGEQETGVLRSRSFVIPPKLTFYLCGHLGFPTSAPVERNFVQLRLDESNQSIAKALPPRSDTAKKIEWDLASHAGKMGYLEITDEIELTAYAWLAVARFEPPVVQVPERPLSAAVDQQIAAATLGSTFRLPELQATYLHLVADTNADWRARHAAAQACLVQHPRPLLAAACSVLTETAVDASLREEIAAQVSKADSDINAGLLTQVMQSIPAREQRQVADALATTSAGGAELLRMVERGQAAARLLQDRGIRQKLNAVGIEDLAARIKKLTESLPPANIELQRLIDERRRIFRNSSPDSAHGQEVFRKHCAICHQVQGQGVLLGPQLDGIGNRGVDRVIEDVLDPNRNVDATFHVTLLTLVDGRVVSGLIRREEGENLVVADQQGKEFTVRRAEVDERNETNNSLMPANVNEILQPNEFRDLVGYLLSLRAKNVEGQGARVEGQKAKD